jgi:hypothetical protein
MALEDRKLTFSSLLHLSKSEPRCRLEMVGLYQFGIPDRHTNDNRFLGPPSAPITNLVFEISGQAGSIKITILFPTRKTELYAAGSTADIATDEVKPLRLPLTSGNEILTAMLAII